VPGSNLSSEAGTLLCHPPSLKKLPKLTWLYLKIGHDRSTVRSLQFICYNNWTPGSHKTVALWEVKVLSSNQRINKPMALFTEIALSASDEPSNPLTVFCGRCRPVRCQLSHLLCFTSKSILKQYIIYKKKSIMSSSYVKIIYFKISRGTPNDVVWNLGWETLLSRDKQHSSLVWVTSVLHTNTWNTSYIQNFSSSLPV
jgi:hypothetical protein